MRTSDRSESTSQETNLTPVPAGDGSPVEQGDSRAGGLSAAREADSNLGPTIPPKTHSRASCTNCGSDLVRRVARRGLFEQLASKIYIFPFRCQLCSHRFRTMRWGVRYDKSPVDRREHERISVDIPVRIPRISSDTSFTIRDISMGGAGIELPQPLESGEVFALDLYTSGVGKPPIHVEAAVVRSARSNFMGIEFLRLAPDDRENLSGLIWKHLVETQRPTPRTKTIGLRIARAQSEPLAAVDAALALASKKDD